MTTLDLFVPGPARQNLQPTEPREVVLWVGITSDVLAGIRDKLPERTRRLLDCVDAGIPHCIGPCDDGTPLAFRRVRYRGTVIGYGIVVAKWQTIAPRPTVPPYFSPKTTLARRFLRSLNLIHDQNLTDRPV